MLSASLIQLEYASKQWKSTFSYCKGSEGTAPLGPGPGSPGAGLAGASGAGAVFTSASSFLVSIFVRPSAYIRLYSAHWMYGAGLLPVRRDRLPLATRNVYSGFNTVFLSAVTALNYTLM